MGRYQVVASEWQRDIWDDVHEVAWKIIDSHTGRQYGNITYTRRTTAQQAADIFNRSDDEQS